MSAPVAEPTIGISESGVYALDAEWRRIPLGDGRYAVVDAAAECTVAHINWRILVGHNGKLYAYGKWAGRTVYMHRLVLGAPRGFEVDHINGDGLDNRRCNLRLATASQNSANTAKPRRPDGAKCSSRFKGVSWDRSRGLWQAKITTHGVCRNLGRYDQEEEAAAAYDAAAVATWGEFARLNLPRDTS